MRHTKKHTTTTAAVQTPRQKNVDLGPPLEEPSIGMVMHGNWPVGANQPKPRPFVPITSLPSGKRKVPF